MHYIDSDIEIFLEYCVLGATVVPRQAHHDGRAVVLVDELQQLRSALRVLLHRHVTSTYALSRGSATLNGLSAGGKPLE